MSKYTPGPWHAITKVAHGAFNKSWQIRTKDGQVICRLPTGLSEELGANADLLEAAPELAEALRSIVDIFGRMPESIDASMEMHRARAALTKAGAA